MGVTDTTNTIKESGNGVKVAYTFDFKAFLSTDLKVYKIDTTTLVATLQTLTTDYSVSLNTITEGGTVTYVTAPTSSEYSFIKRELAFTQSTDVDTEDGLPSSSLNNEYDRSRMIDIQLKEESDRTLKFAETSDLTDITVPESTSAAARASKVIAYDSAGTGLDLVSTTTITNTDPLVVKGDLVQYGTSAVEKLGIGSIGQFLGVASGKASWEELFVKGGDLVAAGTLVVDTDGLAFDVTGATTITDFSGMRVGQMVLLRFDGAPLLTHSADLYLPNAANIQCVAGDVGLFHCHATDDVRLVSWVGSQLPLGDAAATSLTMSGTTETDANTLTKGNLIAFRLNYNHGSDTIVGSYNVSSVNDDGAGDFTITINTDFADATWSVLGAAEASTSAVPLWVATESGVGLAAGTVSLETRNNSGTLADSVMVSVIGVGIQ